jgi:Glyoxalase-like domain
MLHLDHVVLAVGDLDVAAERLLRAQGLASVPGGRHQRWGTANRIVPLGESYIELIAVVDDGAARGSSFGASVARAVADGDRWFTWAVRDDRIEATAQRLGLVVEAGERIRPDGTVIRWRNAGIEDPSRAPALPFFIAWDMPEGLLPGRTPVEHSSGATGIARLELAGDAASLARWTDGADLPVRIFAGSDGLRAVVVRTAGGDVLV